MRYFILLMIFGSCGQSETTKPAVWDSGSEVLNGYKVDSCFDFVVADEHKRVMVKGCNGGVTVYDSAATIKVLTRELILAQKERDSLRRIIQSGKNKIAFL